MKDLGFYLIITAFCIIALALVLSFILTLKDSESITKNLDNTLKNSSEINGLEVLLRIFSNVALMVFFIDRLNVYSKIQRIEFTRLNITLFSSIQILLALAFSFTLFMIAIDIIKYFVNSKLSLCKIRIYLVILVIVLSLIIIPSLIDF